MQRQKIAHIFQKPNPESMVFVQGWIRTKRDAKTFSFLEINDGSCLANIQVIADDQLNNYEMVRKITTGSSVAVSGRLVASSGKEQAYEIQAVEVTIIGLAPESYPLQKKRHSDEFLRTIAHIRTRTNKYGAAFRIRSQMAFAVHQFFREKGFFLVHTPILTGSDCEGAGEMFRVTIQNQDPSASEEDFFGRPANLTVSGQLEAEMMALALGDVYTFGPTFRAENSNTRRHAAEFWMIEPEMSFCDLFGCMELAEEMVKSLVNFALAQCLEDLSLFGRFVDKHLMDTLSVVKNSSFERISYHQAIDVLKNSRQQFDFPIEDGIDLQSEHERFLTEVYFERPVIIFNYPKTIKPFYMRLNDDRQTVAAMDVLVPGIGEIIGGSQREERPEVLAQRMAECGLPADQYWWYSESRQYGSVPHSGFGMGFERLLMMMTGIRNIRDVIPFPRTPKNIEF